MSFHYNLKYKKFNYLGRQLLEKEGEIVLNNNDFCLKGKGGGDKGEYIGYGEVKDMMIKNDSVTLFTVSKDKFQLGDFNNMMEDFLRDFINKRNRILIEALFLKQGELHGEYDMYFEYYSRFDKIISKGKSKLLLYESSLVITPEMREVFSIPFDFIAKQEIDEINYEVRITLENGKKVVISQLHTMFEDFQMKFDGIRERMYQNILDGLRDQLPQYDVQTILKMASLMRGGKATPMKQIKKIDQQLWQDFEEVIFPAPESQRSFELLKKMTAEENIYVGFHSQKNSFGELEKFKSWLLVAIPEQNCIALQINSNDQINTHFFQIIMEKGDPFAKDKERIQEINQTMLTFNFDIAIFAKDRKDLRKTKYRLALAKVPFLRSLRKSYLGRAYFKTEEDWQKYVDLMLNKAAQMRSSSRRNTPKITKKKPAQSEEKKTKKTS